jgi:hypothetical protein
MKKLFVKDGEHRAVRGGRGEERHGQTDQRPRATTNAPDQNVRGKNEFGLKNCHSGHKAKKPIPTPPSVPRSVTLTIIDITKLLL